MKLSCLPVSFFNAILQDDMSLDDWFQFAAELGLDGIECSPVLIQPRGKVTAAEFRRLAERRQLAVSNYTAYSDFAHPDPAARQQEVADAIGNVRIAVELGSSTVRVLSGQRWPGVDEDQGVAWVVDSVKRVAEEADRLGVKLVLENHSKAFVWTYFDFAQNGDVFLRLVDGLRDSSAGVMFDTANPLVAGEDALTLFEAVKDRIGFVHVNDVRRPGAFEFVTVGSGIAPIPEILSRLRSQGYSGWLSIEEASRTGKSAFQEATRFVRQAWEGALQPT